MTKYLFKALWWLGWVWTLPNTIFHAIIALILGAKLVKICPDGVFYFLATPGSLYDKWFTNGNFTATTLGCCITFDKTEFMSDTIIIHERTHVQQCLILGVLDGPLYGLSSLYAIIRGKDDYWNNWFEEQAYRSQTVGRSLWLWE